MSVNTDIDQLTETQEKMRRDLYYHFMNPRDKWKAKGTLPIKLGLTIIKVCLITIQLIYFSTVNVNEVSFFEGSKISFKHLFLQNWDSSQETPIYPPSHGAFAVYTIPKYYEALNYALERYYNLSDLAIGPYSYGDDGKPYAKYCYSAYNVSILNEHNRKYHFSNNKINQCVQLKPIKGPNGTTEFDSKTYLEYQGYVIDFNGLISSTLSLNFRSIQLKYFELEQRPSCYEFQINILFDNSNHNGQAIISLDSSVKNLDSCNGTDRIRPDSFTSDMLLLLDVFVMLFSFTSLLLSCRSICRLFFFWKKVKKFFLEELNTDVKDKRSLFYGSSYIVILFGDSFNLIGTALKIHLFSEGNDSTTFHQNLKDMVACSWFLGLGLFLGYCTIIRYCSYFPKSSILVNTIRYALFPLLRFSLCSIILFLGFGLLGWVVLGPYHIKFKSLRSSMACLFSLMNGDDMYVTLTIINQDSSAIVIFAQLLIYIFCILFIFVVLNLILTIIIEAYEQVKQSHYNSNFQNDIFWNFINSCPETANSVLFRHDRQIERSKSQQKNTHRLHKILDMLCCCIGRENHTHELMPQSSQNRGYNNQAVTINIDEASCEHCGHNNFGDAGQPSEMTASMFGGRYGFMSQQYPPPPLQYRFGMPPLRGHHMSLVGGWAHDDLHERHTSLQPPRQQPHINYGATVDRTQCIEIPSPDLNSKSERGMSL